MIQPKRFYIVTGKGGVGKTAHALALTKYLQSQGINARFYYFKESSIGKKESLEKSSDEKYFDQLDIPYQALKMDQNAEDYIAQKLGSHMVAKWIVGTSFFKALINMLPGFGYLIYLGKIMNDLIQDESLVAILDSPSSGHALTMLEATQNFKEIFSSGIIFEDTKEMYKYINDPSFTQVNIITIPTAMAITEAIELEEEIKKLMDIPCCIISNNELSKNDEINKLSELPSFLEQKISMEEQALAGKKQRIKKHFPHIASTKDRVVVDQIVPLMKNLV